MAHMEAFLMACSSSSCVEPESESVEKLQACAAVPFYLRTAVDIVFIISNNEEVGLEMLNLLQQGEILESQNHPGSKLRPRYLLGIGYDFLLGSHKTITKKGMN